MSNLELINETNRLLKRFLELDEERKVELASAREKLETRFKSYHDSHAELLNNQLREAGAEAAIAEGTDKDWDERSSKIRKKSQLKQEELLEHHRQYQINLQAELSAQTELLRRIADKLGA